MTEKLLYGNNRKQFLPIYGFSGHSADTCGCQNTPKEEALSKRENWSNNINKSTLLETQAYPTYYNHKDQSKGAYLNGGFRKLCLANNLQHLVILGKSENREQYFHHGLLTNLGSGWGGGGGGAS